MIVSGKMLESLKVKKRKNNSLSIFFGSRIARFHNTDGAGINKIIRRLLPDRQGEKFTVALQKRILSETNRIVSKEVKRQNT